jgi:hypothetical protein
LSILKTNAENHQKQIAEIFFLTSASPRLFDEKVFVGVVFDFKNSFDFAMRTKLSPSIFKRREIMSEQKTRNRRMGRSRKQFLCCDVEL